MAFYPTCVRCNGTDSEVDVAGICTTCQSRGSKETPIRTGPRAPVPKPVRPDPDVTKTEPKVDVATRTGPGTDGSTLATPVPAAPPPTPQTFSHYDNLEYLDAGGMGFVYKARDTRTGRAVALKLMKGVALGDGRLRARFLTEGKALARLSHPGVVQVYEVDEWEGTPFIAMEYVSGGSLAKRLRKGDRPTPVEAAKLMAEVASAVAAAHDKQILHRDLKPGNILLTDAGRPKLADFGLAALVDETTRMTNPGGLLGTPAYMAPEQAAGRFGDVGPRADVYGLGATLYDVLTGQPPFKGDHPMKVVHSVIHDDPVPPSKRVEGIPADLERVVLRCLEKRPQDRCESAAALASDLMRVVRGEPVGKPGVVWYVRRFVRRNGKVMGAVVAVALLTGAAAMLGTKPKANDPLIANKKIAMSIKKNTPVILAKDRGLPDYYFWEIRESTLSERKTTQISDGATTFHANHLVMCSLCTDTIIDQYKIEAEIQHCSAWNGDAEVGLFIKSLGEGNILRWVTIDFNDFPPINTNSIAGCRYKFMERIGFVQSTGMPTSQWYCADSKKYSPSNRMPRPFRKIELVVDKDKYSGKLLTRNDEGEWLGIAEVDYHSSLTASINADIQHKLLNMNFRVENHPKAPFRGSVGVYAIQSEIAFRNVIFTPLPQR